MPLTSERREGGLSTSQRCGSQVKRQVKCGSSQTTAPRCVSPPLCISGVWIVGVWIVGVWIVGWLIVEAWLVIVVARLARGLESEARARLCPLMRERHAPLCERIPFVSLQSAIETDQLDRNGNFKVCLARARGQALFINKDIVTISDLYLTIL